MKGLTEAQQGIKAVRTFMKLNDALNVDDIAGHFDMQAESVIMGNHVPSDQPSISGDIHGVVRKLVGYLGKLQDEDTFSAKAKAYHGTLKQNEGEYRDILKTLKKSIAIQYPTVNYKTIQDMMMACIPVNQKSQFNKIRETDKSKSLDLIQDADIQTLFRSADYISDDTTVTLNGLSSELNHADAVTFVNGETVPNSHIWRSEKSVNRSETRLSLWMYCAKRATSRFLDTTRHPDSYADMYTNHLGVTVEIIDRISETILSKPLLHTSPLTGEFVKGVSKAQSIIAARHNFEDILASDYSDILDIKTPEDYQAILQRTAKANGTDHSMRAVQKYAKPVYTGCPFRTAQLKGSS